MLEADADRIRSSYLAKYGTTLAGLMEEGGLRPEAFLEFVHDLDLSALNPDQELIAALARLPGRKVVFTNGPAIHANRVLSRLGLDTAFDAVFDIAAAGYQPKPATVAFERFRLAHAFETERSAFFDDQTRNLVYPHQIGMSCVFVGVPPVTPAEHVHVAVEYPLPLLQLLF
jgi:putative hydrolase of the HAD superfamily